VILFAALVWACMNVWTAPMGVIWHTFHGGSASFEGHKIHVPWDMIVLQQDDQSITIIREAPKYPILRSPRGVIQIARNRAPATDMSQYYDRIARTNELPPKGYTFQGLHQLSAPKGTVYCWEMARLDSSELSISCWFDKDTLGAALEGSPVYSQEFYKAVETVSGAYSPANR
jgi:hypothetical protein